ncbi:MAG: hypothetical protein US42_C0002G0073 [Candidatus Magasanikbacteria bacterium GW2011_GWC2_37_14]|uniref:Uncharacterized protein n=1 Tax=Candidatus Magasanikbacteria bacterium GW2011_GWC2_37_14 TaxID=1619046 RepID=A0A0G0GAJ8_9BACT|nr:MAG: hypothetical protein US42_C0002G0073 [Candidatus Magasanikbacteria bacterium GW2011_GWC2_37_14]
MLDNFKKETKKVGTEVKQKIGTYVLAGFGLVAGLAWNEAIKGLIERYFPLASGGGLLAKFIYAVIITIVIVVVSIYILKSEKSNK